MEKAVSKDQEESTSRVMGNKSCPSELLKVLDAQEHVAACRREKTCRVSIPHHPGTTCSSGMKEAYVMNRMKKEKSVLRKEGNLYVLDLFVKVPSGAAAPIKHKPMEVDAINQVADGRERRKRVTFDCSKPYF